MHRILIVDDEQNIRFLYKEEFQDEGYEVAVASDGKEAMRKIRESNPELIILDYKMPEIDGLKLMENIITDGFSVPIILCSAYAHHMQQLLNESVIKYVLKSADLTELKQSVKNILEN